MGCFRERPDVNHDAPTPSGDRADIFSFSTPLARRLRWEGWYGMLARPRSRRRRQMRGRVFLDRAAMGPMSGHGVYLSAEAEPKVEEMRASHWSPSRFNTLWRTATSPLGGARADDQRGSRGNAGQCGRGTWMPHFRLASQTPI